MTRYNFLLCSRRSRIKYPKSFYLSDIEAARQVASRIARGFGGAVPQWRDLSAAEQSNFTVQAVDETGQTVLTVPVGDEAHPSPDREGEPSEHKEAPPGLLN